MAISYLFRFALISVSICCTSCQQGVVALVPAQQDESQETEASKTHSTPTTSKASRTNTQIEEGWRRHTSTFFTFDYPEDWLIDEARELGGSDAMQIVCSETGPDFFTANMTIQSVHMPGIKDLAEWERHGNQVREIDSRKFKFDFKREPFLIPPSYPIQIDQRAYIHYDEVKKRMFLVHITCGSKNTKDLKLATKVANSLKINFPEVQQPSPQAKSVFQNAWRHENGLAGRVDHKTAQRGYQRAAKLGSLLAELALASGDISREEIRHAFAEEQYARCRKLLGAAVALADSGDREAQTLVGNCYLHGYGVTADWEMAEHWLKKASDRDCPVAMLSLSMLLLEKDPESFPAGIRLLRRAVDLQNPHAELWLGVAYFYGKGVEKSTQKGFDWTLKAAEKGVDPAIADVADKYFEPDEGLQADFDKAYKWFLHGSKKGIPRCIHGFSHMVWKKEEYLPALSDKEVESAFADIEAEIADSPISEFAYATALRGLGEITENKKQSDRYIKKSGELMTKYAKKESPDAWYELMKLYKTIDDIRPGSVDGKIPYCRRRAAELGHKEAKNEFDSIEKLINKKTRAHLLSVEWDKAAARKQESLGGFVAPDWAYERTPTVKEFREKHRTPLYEKDVLFK